MRLTLAALCWLLAATVQAIPVVPGAPNAAGMDTRAAYCDGTNPTVYKVTSLADSGAGTLRNAMEASGNRVIVFERSGTIQLTSNIFVGNPCMTVAGQTAPSPGILIRDYGIAMNTHDVLIQHLELRKGTLCANNEENALEMWGSNTYNIVIDHVSASWGQDETVVVYNQTRAANTVIWRSVITEGLFHGGPACSQDSAGHSLFVYTDTKGVTVAQSLIGKSEERNPYSLGGAGLTLINSVIFGWQGIEGVLFSNFDSNGSPGSSPWKVSAVGNRFVANARSIGATMFGYSPNGGTPGGNQIYRSDNTLANNPGGISEEYNGLPYDPNVGSPPALAPLPSGYSMLASTAVEAVVTASAGSRPDDRGEIDTRIFSEVAARSSAVGQVEDPSDVGGFPTLAVNVRTLTLPSNPNGDDDADGYTNLEEWLQSYALLVEGEDIDIDPGPDDVTPAAGTVTTSATFTCAEGTPITSYTSGTGGGWVPFAGVVGVLSCSNANRIMGTSVAEGSLTLSVGPPLSPQYDVDSDWQVFSILEGNSYSVWAHTLPNIFTGIAFDYDTSASVGTLSYFINGGQTILGTCSMSLSVGSHHVILRVRTATMHAIVDGVQCASAEGSPLPAMGQAGLATFHSTADTNSTGIHYDNFIVTDLDTEEPPSTVTRQRIRFKR